MGGRLFIGAWATCRWLHNWGKKITCPNNCCLSIVFHGGMGSHGLLSFPINRESLRVQSRVGLARSGTVSCRVYAMVVLSPECVSPNITVASHSSSPSVPLPPHCNAPWAPIKTAICLYITFLLIYLRLIYYILTVWVYCLQANLCTKYIQRGVSRGQRRPRVPETGGTDDCELPCEIWKLSPGPLQELQGSVAAEPAL